MAQQARHTEAKLIMLNEHRPGFVEKFLLNSDIDMTTRSSQVLLLRQKCERGGAMQRSSSYISGRNHDSERLSNWPPISDVLVPRLQGKPITTEV